MSNFHEISFARIANGENEIELSISPTTLEQQLSASYAHIQDTNDHERPEFEPIHNSASTDKFEPFFGGKSSWLEGSFNFVNSILGAGIIGVPLAIMQCGLIVGVLVYALVAYFVYSSVLMLIQCGIKTKIFDLEDLAEHTLGTFGYCMAVGSMFLMSCGGLVAYLVIIGDTVPSVAQTLSSNALQNRETAMFLFAFFIILPLCLFRDLSHLAWTSLLSIVMEMGLLLVVILAANQQDTSSQHGSSVASTASSAAASYLHLSLFAGIGTMSFGLVCQHNSFLVFKSLRQPTIATWRKVAGSSVSFGFILSLAFGLVGFFAFFPHVQGDILNNFPAKKSELITAGRSILAATMLFTYPMECYVSRHCLYSLITRYRHWQPAKKYSRHIVRSHQRLPDDEEEDDDESQFLSSVAWWRRCWWRRRSIRSTRRRASSISDGVSQRQQIVVGFEVGVARHRDLDDNSDHERTKSHSHDDEDDMVVISFQDEDGEEQEDSEHQPKRKKKEQSRFVLSAFSGRISTRSPNTDNMVYFTDVECEQNVNNDATINPLQSENNDQSILTSNDNNTGNEQHNDDAAGPPVLGFKSTTEHAFWTVVLWGSSLLIAICSKKLGVVSTLTGAAAASTLGYTLPALIYLKVHEKELYQVFSVLLGIPPSGNDPADIEQQENIVHRNTIWQALWKFLPFMLPIMMLVFGVALFFVGITTVFVSDG